PPPMPDVSNDLPAVPPPVVPSTTSTDAPPPLLPPQVPENYQGNGLGVPTLPPASSPDPAAVNRLATSVVPSNNPLAGVLDMLPKELAAGLEHVLGPKPVDVPAQQGTIAPQVRNVTVDRSGHYAPSPVPSLNKELFENLVTARVGADAI